MGVTPGHLGKGDPPARAGRLLRPRVTVSLLSAHGPVSKPGRAQRWSSAGPAWLRRRSGEDGGRGRRLTEVGEEIERAAVAKRPGDPHRGLHRRDVRVGLQQPDRVEVDAGSLGDVDLTNPCRLAAPLKRGRSSAWQSAMIVAVSNAAHPGEDNHAVGGVNPEISKPEFSSAVTNAPVTPDAGPPGPDSLFIDVGPWRHSSAELRDVRWQLAHIALVRCLGESEAFWTKVERVHDGGAAQELARVYGNGSHGRAVIADLLTLAAQAGDRARAYQRLTLAPMRTSTTPDDNEPPRRRPGIYAPRRTDRQDFPRKMRTGALAIARRGEPACLLCGTRLAKDNTKARWCRRHNAMDAVNVGHQSEVTHAMEDVFRLMRERCRPDEQALARLDDLAGTDQLAAWLDPVNGPLLDMPNAPKAARGPWRDRAQANHLTGRPVVTRRPRP